MRNPGRQDHWGDEGEERRALVGLSLIPGVGPGRIRSLVSRFGSAAAVLSAPVASLAEVQGIGRQTAQAIAHFDPKDQIEEQFVRAERCGATILPYWDEHYPALLREIYDPPAFIWMRGEILESDERSVAIVGTRRATEYGRQAAHRFGSDLARAGFTVVSGLAYGIDAAAHRGALEAGGRTIAVLGSGVDRIYPGSHERLARSVIEQGAVISEYAMGAAPDASNFPRRNRIISGVTKGILVVEAHDSGGALITARLAVEQNREVFAIPSPLHSDAGIGTNRLIQRGHAKLVLNVEDILAELGEIPIDVHPTPDASLLQELSTVERKLYEALSEQPLHIDVLCTETGMDPSTALVYLLSLEFKGLVGQMAGKQFFRS